MLKKDKGEAGYLKEKKKISLIVTISAFIVVVAIFLIGAIVYKTRNNIMTVVSIVSVLPAAKIAVGYMVLLPHKSCDEKLVHELESKASGLVKFFDLIISNSKKPIGVQACFVTDCNVCLFTNEENIDKSFIEKSIVTFIKNEKLTVSVNLYFDKGAFIKRAETLSLNFDYEDKNKVDKMKWNAEALLHMCI